MMISILSLLFVILVQSAATGAVDSHYISNGTCYYRSNARSDDNIAPAGNIAYGHTFCCAFSDKINSNNACMDESIGYVYLAGCTDPTYQHSSCPPKGVYTGQPWVGLSQCLGEGWAGCPNDGSPTPRKSSRSEGCTCNSTEDELLFESTSNGLDAVGYMPERQGDTISYLAGMKPTSFSAYPTELAEADTTSFRSLVTPTTRPATNSGSASSAQTDDPITSSISSQSSNTGGSPLAGVATSTAASAATGSLSHGAIAGISIGGFLAGLLLFGAAFLFWRQQRRKKELQEASDKENESFANTPDTDSAVPGFAEVDSRASTFAETKSELPGSPVTSQGTVSQRESLSSQTPPPSPTQKEQVYKPFRYQPGAGMHNIQELPGQERPQWTQAGERMYGPNNSNRRGGGGHVGDDIHELPA